MATRRSSSANPGPDPLPVDSPLMLDMQCRRRREPNRQRWAGELNARKRRLARFLRALTDGAESMCSDLWESENLVFYLNSHDRNAALVAFRSFSRTWFARRSPFPVIERLPCFFDVRPPLEEMRTSRQGRVVGALRRYRLEQQPTASELLRFMEQTETPTLGRPALDLVGLRALLVGLTDPKQDPRVLGNQEQVVQSRQRKCSISGRVVATWGIQVTGSRAVK